MGGSVAKKIKTKTKSAIKNIKDNPLKSLGRAVTGAATLGITEVIKGKKQEAASLANKAESAAMAQVAADDAKLAAEKKRKKTAETQQASIAQQRGGASLLTGARGNSQSSGSLLGRRI